MFYFSNSLASEQDSSTLLCNNNFKYENIKQVQQNPDSLR